ncbi:hypothetical protein C1646_677405 [Rhizophagus diaphanus]|nr:hypothetical protein C1646_677405 [Rhizophagus diaphanus] [Rhizophagus sp. MUCL 43196]
MYDSLPEHLRCFSEAVFDDLPQSPSVHVKFSSPTPFPGTPLVNILKQILSGMLAEFCASYFDKANAPKDLTDLVVMDECGRDSYGFWTYSFHIQAPSFSFCNYDETICFTDKVISRLPKEIGLFVVRDPSQQVRFVRILGWSSSGETLHKKLSCYSQFLGTKVDIHRDELFVKKFLDENEIGLHHIRTSYHVPTTKDNPEKGFIPSGHFVSSPHTSTATIYISVNTAEMFITTTSIEKVQSRMCSSYYPIYETINVIALILALSQKLRRVDTKQTHGSTYSNEIAFRYSTKIHLDDYKKLFSQKKKKYLYEEIE